MAARRGGRLCVVHEGSRVAASREGSCLYRTRAQELVITGIEGSFGHQWKQTSPAQHRDSHAFPSKFRFCGLCSGELVVASFNTRGFAFRRTQFRSFRIPPPNALSTFIVDGSKAVRCKNSKMCLPRHELFATSFHNILFSSTVSSKPPITASRPARVISQYIFQSFHSRSFPTSKTPTISP